MKKINARTFEDLASHEKYKLTLEEIKKMQWQDSDSFVEMMEGFIQRYKEDVKENKGGYIKNWDDEKFRMWHIIKDAYDNGCKYTKDYWVGLIWELSDVEDVIRDKIRDEI